MLSEATSTSFWRQNFLGLSSSDSSSLETLQRFSMKSMMAFGLSLSLYKKISSIWLASISSAMIWQFLISTC
jgi:hypothetical protein